MQYITTAALLIIYLQICLGFNNRFTSYRNSFRLSCISSDDQLSTGLSSDDQLPIEKEDTIEISPPLVSVEEDEEFFANPDEILNQKEVLPYSPGIYVLELENNGIYVGKSNQNVEARVKEHFTSGGSAFTKRFKPLSQLLTITPATTDLESFERAETLEQMWVNGISNVRGWQYTKIELTEFEYESIFRQMCERKDLCRKCGRDDHMMSSCNYNSLASWIGQGNLLNREMLLKGGDIKKKKSPPSTIAAVKPDKGKSSVPTGWAPKYVPNSNILLNPPSNLLPKDKSNKENSNNNKSNTDKFNLKYGSKNSPEKKSSGNNTSRRERRNNEFRPVVSNSEGTEKSGSVVSSGDSQTKKTKAMNAISLSIGRSVILAFILNLSLALLYRTPQSSSIKSMQFILNRSPLCTIYAMLGLGVTSILEVQSILYISWFDRKFGRSKMKQILSGLFGISVFLMLPVGLVPITLAGEFGKAIRRSEILNLVCFIIAKSAGQSLVTWDWLAGTDVRRRRAMALMSTLGQVGILLGWFISRSPLI